MTPELAIMTSSLLVAAEFTERATWSVAIINFLWAISSFFLIVIILLQRGKGGGLVGALGGVGGSSAFGTRAGDVFTKITVGVFLAWLLVGVALIPMMSRQSLFQSGAKASSTPGMQLPSGDESIGGLPQSGTPAANGPIDDAAKKVEAKSGDAPASAENKEDQ